MPIILPINLSRSGSIKNSNFSSHLEIEQFYFRDILEQRGEGVEKIFLTKNRMVKLKTIKIERIVFWQKYGRPQ